MVLDRPRKLKHLALLDVTNNFYKIEEDIQLCIDFDSTCNEFWMYHYKTNYKTRFSSCKWHYLKNFIDKYHYRLCWDDK